MKTCAFAVAALAASVVAASEVAVNFNEETGRVRPELHSSGYAPKMNRRTNSGQDKYIKAMNFHAARTHDHALINAGARICDTHFIFPLMHLDPKGPQNYYFAQTDYFLGLQRKMGLKTFFRLGTSIEHTGLVHFNAEVPTDFDKLAEVFAGTVRHYTRGWANGKTWDIDYWEIWNEPDGNNNMWSFNGGLDDHDVKSEHNTRRRALFVEFFVKVLKRLKAEFPELKIGGPAMCAVNELWFRDILKACKAAGVKPDFISWHYYGNEPQKIIDQADVARKVLRETGFGDDNIELIINEWHFIPDGGWGALGAGFGKPNSPTHVGPHSINGIDSACFTLTVLAKLQSSRYSQSYFYGCRFDGNWGFMNALGIPNKNYYALKAFGELMKLDTAVACKSSDPAVSVFAAKAKDGRRRSLIVADYRGKDGSITLDVKGAEGARKVTARVLSDANNLEPVEVKFADGKATLVKPDAFSAAYLIDFE